MVTTHGETARTIGAEIRKLHSFQEAGLQRFTGWLPRAVVVVALGMSFGLAGVVAGARAQSDMMKKDGMKKEEMEKGDKMREKGDDTMMKSDDKTMMKKDDTMMKDDKAMEKKP